jgi:Fe-S cluster assembly ATPase SufC
MNSRVYFPALTLSLKKKVGVRKFAIHKPKLIIFDNNDEKLSINRCVVVAVVVNTHSFFIIMQVIRRDEK